MNVRYNVIGFYPRWNDYCLIKLGTSDKEQMTKVLEDIKANPEKHGVNLDKVTELKLEKVDDTPDNWWNGNLD